MPLLLRRPGRRSTFAAIPALALALAAGSALPLGVAAPVAAHAGHGASAGHGSHGGHEGESVASRASADAGESLHHAMGSRATVGGSPASRATNTKGHGSTNGHASMTSMWEVGTATRPLIMRSGRGPLWADASVNAPGMTSHGTLGSAVVAGLIAARREAAEDEALATRAELNTAQATKQLSKRCQRLIKRKASRLSKADRKRRAACIAQRRKRIDDANRPPATAAPAPGVSAPTPPVSGPAPTTAPPTTTPPAGEPTPSPTPTPAGPVYGAVGVSATEGAQPFKLTRTSVTADVVSFELVNTDSQPHDLFIAPADENDQISGPLTQIIGRTAGQSNGKPTRAVQDMTLAPGRYRLICTVPGHGKMEVGFTVYAPKS